MKVEQVWIGSLRRQEFVNFVRSVAIVQTRPKIGLPSRTPTGRFVATMFHGYQGRFVELLGCQRRDITAGMQSHQVRNMAVGHFEGL